jgi:uncharacterized membrane protein YgcG
VPAGESLSPSQRARIARAVRNAERISELTFSVYLGVAEEDARGYAERLHAALPDPAGSVLVLCDPAFRALEIVTGERARRQLDDVACGLALASMKSSFQGGDLVAGLAAGIQQLGEAAHQPRTLHGQF